MQFDYDGRKIAALRKQQGLTMAELARRAGIKQPSLWALEHQVTKKPKYETLASIAAVLGVSARELGRAAGRHTQANEEKLLSTFSALDEPNRQLLMGTAELLLKNQGKTPR